MTNLQRHVLMQTRQDMLTEARFCDQEQIRKQLHRMARSIQEVLQVSRTVRKTTPKRAPKGV